MISWQSCFDTSQLVEIRNAGHNYFWDNAEETNRLVKEFLIREIQV